ncbi:MAG: efflux RND transporter periplasmic adaptor subunit [Sphingomonadaceae bacterium]
MSNRSLFRASAAVIALTLAAACDKGGEPPAEPTAAATAASDDLQVDADQAAQTGIRVETATAATEAPLATVPALIQPPANARVAVAATFPGVVVRTMVVEGDTVRKGQPLAVISSRDVLTMGADLARAEARLGVAAANAARLAQLSKEGIIAAARADEAQALAAEARTDVSEKSRILKRVSGDGAKGVYTLTAPIAGRVTAADIQTGNPVDGGTAPYVIDAANRYEAVGQLPERLVGIVRPGMTVRIGQDVQGRVTSAGSTIDPTTRSASLKAEIPAGPGIIAGRTTSLAIFGAAPAGAVSLPTSAVTGMDGRTVVFVKTVDGFAIREVTGGGSGGGQTLILSGVQPGEQIVVTGTSALKALALSR